VSATILVGGDVRIAVGYKVPEEDDNGEDHEDEDDE
jgi:hypothetical protein